MSDLFHERVEDSYIETVLDVMRLGDWHIFQVLTKRAQRMNRLLKERHQDLLERHHIWLGVSVENRKHGIPRIQELRETPASVRFLSIEPLIEDLGTIDLNGIDWVIVGGESGPRARPMERSWVISIHEQCQAARVPFFFKQWGGVQKKRAGRDLEGRTWDEFPQIDMAPPPSREEYRRRKLAGEQLRRIA